MMPCINCPSIDYCYMQTLENNNEINLMSYKQQG
jgi:hypothetical protein